LAFHIVEEVIKLFVHGEKIVAALHHVRIDQLLSGCVIVFCTFIPLFAFRELQRVLGEENFRALFFRTGAMSKSDVGAATSLSGTSVSVASVRPQSADLANTPKAK
jgi:hypothetical protein